MTSECLWLVYDGAVTIFLLTAPGRARIVPFLVEREGSCLLVRAEDHHLPADDFRDALAIFHSPLAVAKSNSSKKNDFRLLV